MTTPTQPPGPTAEPRVLWADDGEWRAVADANGEVTIEWREWAPRSGRYSAWGTATDIPACVTEELATNLVAQLDAAQRDLAAMAEVGDRYIAERDTARAETAAAVARARRGALEECADVFAKGTKPWWAIRALLAKEK